MGSEKYRTFASEQPGIQRNVRSGCAGMLIYIPFVEFVGMVFLVFLYWLGSKKNKDYSHFKNESVYNTVDVGDNNILLRMNGWSRSRSDHRMSVTNIEKIIVKNIFIDDALSNTQMKVYEFHHKWKLKPLLRYDLEDQDSFEELLKQKGIVVEHES